MGPLSDILSPHSSGIIIEEGIKDWKSQTQWMPAAKQYFLDMTGCCTHAHTMAVTACLRPAQEYVAPNHNVNGRGTIKFRCAIGS